MPLSWCPECDSQEGVWIQAGLVTDLVTLVKAREGTGCMGTGQHCGVLARQGPDRMNLPSRIGRST